MTPTEQVNYMQEIPGETIFGDEKAQAAYNMGLRHGKALNSSSAPLIQRLCEALEKIRPSNEAFGLESDVKIIDAALAEGAEWLKQEGGK